MMALPVGMVEKATLPTAFLDAAKALHACVCSGVRAAKSVSILKLWRASGGVTGIGWVGEGASPGTLEPGTFVSGAS